MEGFMCFASLGGLAPRRDRENREGKKRRRHGAVVVLPNATASQGSGETLRGQTIAISGATGFVGNRVVRRAAAEGAQRIVVLTRNLNRARNIFPKSEFPLVQIVRFDSAEQPTALTDQQLASVISKCDVVINLAGESLSEGRWSERRKQQIIDSRLVGTKRLVSAMQRDASSKAPLPPLISASAVGFYGSSQTETFDESSPAGNDFLAKLASSWEQAAFKAADHGHRTVVLRLGLVMGRDGGALKTLIPIFRSFLGGPIGGGSQWVSWVHIDDVVNIIVKAAAAQNYEGVYNVTAPRPARLREVCDELGRILGRPSWISVPSSVVYAALGEAAELILKGQRVMPDRLMKSGYRFRYDTLSAAFRRTFADADQMLR